MNLIQFIIIAVVFIIILWTLLKNKKKMDEKNKYIFKGGLLIWLIFLFMITINSGIINTKLPEELGGGARYHSQMEERVDEVSPPVLKNKNTINYKKEGEKALQNALK